MCYKSKLLLTIKCKINQCNKSGKESHRVFLEHDHFNRNKPETTKIKKVNRKEGLFGEYMLSFKVFYPNGCNYIFLV